MRLQQGVVAEQFGLAHPFGQPLHTMLGGVLARLPGVDPLVALNGLSALFSALTVIPATSFAEALSAAGREDPDVILVGELRDLETISTALTAAETGHLVFGTLHTTTAASTVDRVIERVAAVRPEILSGADRVAEIAVVPGETAGEEHGE